MLGIRLFAATVIVYFMSSSNCFGQSCLTQGTVVDCSDFTFDIEPSRDVWATGYSGEFYKIKICLVSSTTETEIIIRFCLPSGDTSGVYLFQVASDSCNVIIDGTEFQGFSRDVMHVSPKCCQFSLTAVEAMNLTLNGTMILVLAESLCRKQNIFLQDCSIAPLNDNVLVSSQDPTYGNLGLYHCAGNGVLFNSSGSEMSHRTVCENEAIWENQNEAQCWYEPDVTMDGINVEEKDYIFTVNASYSFDVLCKYHDVFPPGNESSYFFNNTKSTIAKTDVYTLTLTRYDNQKKLWCQALTPFTEYFSSNGTSLNYTINVRYAPYSEDVNDCSCIVDQNCSCNVRFFSNPDASFVTLIKNGSRIEDASNQLTAGGETYQQIYTFTEDLVEEEDYGTYILVLFSPFDNSHHTIMFEVKVLLYPPTSKPPPSQSSNSVPIPLVIGVIVGAVALAILTILLICYWRKKKLKRQDGAQETHPEKHNPSGTYQLRIQQTLHEEDNRPGTSQLRVRQAHQEEDDRPGISGLMNSTYKRNTTDYENLKDNVEASVDPDGHLSLKALSYEDDKKSADYVNIQGKDASTGREGYVVMKALSYEVVDDPKKHTYEYISRSEYESIADVKVGSTTSTERAEASSSSGRKEENAYLTPIQLSSGNKIA